MKLLKAISSAVQRIFKASRQIIIIWLISTLTLSVLMVPFKNMVISYAGSSMLPEIMAKGFDISYWLEMGNSMKHLVSSFSAGLMVFIAISLILNIFLSGGLFDNLRVNSCSYRPSDFFSASARLFFPYLWVNLLVILIIIASLLLIIGAPLFILRSGSGGEDTMLGVMKIFRIVMVAVMLVYLLVADYARAWLAASGRRNVFKAVGYGFKATFSSFANSYLFMLFAVALQVAFTILAAKVLDSMEPQGASGLFLLWVVSQAFIISRIYLRAYRYAGITALYALG